MTLSTKIGFIALGCAKNQVDAEVMLNLCREAGYQLVSEPAHADIVIIHTCGFIESARMESVEQIVEMAALKKEGVIRSIIVTGCLSERYKDELKKEIPEIDAVLGVAAHTEVVEAVRAVEKSAWFESFPPVEEMALGGTRMLSTPFYTAYLKVAEGCDNRCSYCMIPTLRGPMRSRPMEELVSEAEELAKSGVTELNVIAQDTSRYGTDLYGSPSLAPLLRQLCRIEGLRWIRLLYLYPDEITDDLIEAMHDEEKIVSYMDLPLQHISAPILRAMNRRGTPEEIRALLARLRHEIPDITLRTTFIVGFPGETEAQLTELCEFVKETEFDRLGAFTYSQEEGTKAAELPDQLPEDVKARRLETLMDLQAEISAKKNEAKVGGCVTVLIEGYDRNEKLWFGRTAADAPEVDGKVFFRAERPVEIGDYVPVTVDEAMDYDLFGVARATEENA